MKTWKKSVVALSALALAATAGAAASWASSPSAATHQPAVVQHVVSPMTASQAVLDASKQMTFSPVAACRIVDTVKVHLRIPASGRRSFLAAGDSGFTTQGGTSGGCGIPVDASAIEASVYAVGASGPGNLRIAPFGTSVPIVPAMAYTGATTSSQLMIPIHTSGSEHFTVEAVSHATDVIVNVVGFYIKPMWAEVAPNGTLLQGSRSPSSSFIAAGQYQVNFDRNVTGCAYVATPFSQRFTIIVEPRSGAPDAVFVDLVDSSGTLADAQFYLQVSC